MIEPRVNDQDGQLVCPHCGKPQRRPRKARCRHCGTVSRGDLEVCPASEENQPRAKLSVVTETSPLSRAAQSRFSDMDSSAMRPTIAGETRTTTARISSTATTPFFTFYSQEAAQEGPDASMQKATSRAGVLEIRAECHYHSGLSRRSGTGRGLELPKNK